MARSEATAQYDKLTSTLLIRSSQHKAAVTCIKQSWSHLYTSSDDGDIRIWCLTTYSIQRTLHCGSRIKCVYIDEAHENEETTAAAGQVVTMGGSTNDMDKEPPCGFLYAGLTNGYVQKWRIGQWM